MSESQKDESNLESTSGQDVGSSPESKPKKDSESNQEEAPQTTLDGHDNKGFYFGEDPLDPNNYTNRRLNSTRQSQEPLPPSSSPAPPPYHPSSSVSDKAIDAYTPESDVSLPVSTTHVPSTADHQFDSTNGPEPTSHNVPTISHRVDTVGTGSINGRHNLHADPAAYDEQNGAIPIETQKPDGRSFCATLALICLIFIFLFLFLAVAVFAAIYFTVLFPSTSRGDVNEGISTTIRPMFPAVEEISVGVTMTLNQSYQALYNDVMSTEYQQLEYNITSAMNSTFTNSELMGVYVRTDLDNVRSGSILAYCIVHLSDVPPGASLSSGSSSETAGSPIEQIQAHVQMLVLDILQTAAETEDSALTSLKVDSNSIIVETPVVIPALTTTPIVTTKLTTTVLTSSQTTTTTIPTTQTPSGVQATRQSTISTTTPAQTQTATVPLTTYQGDIAPPVLTCPEDTQQFTDPGQPNTVVTWTPATAIDNSGNITSLESDHNSGSFFSIGVTMVTYTASDEAGNVGMCMFQITVKDNEPPLLLCPPTVRAETNPGENVATGVTWGRIFASDNSRSVSAAEGDHDDESVFPVGPTIVTYTATDQSGNVGNCSFFVIIEDKEGPQLTCPADIVQAADQDADSTSVTWTDPVIDDNLQDTVTLEANYDSGSTFVIGQYVVVYMATDDAGNSGQCSFIITVEDTQPPILTCPDDQTTTNDPGLGTADVTWSDVVVTDNSGESPVAFSNHPSGFSFPIGNTVVLYSAIDDAENVGTCTIVITVQDIDPPSVTCPSLITIPNNPGLGTAVVTWSDPTVSDNSQSDVQLVPSMPSGSSFGIGRTTVRYTATDKSGNEAQCSFKVQVDDVEPPVLYCPGNQTKPADLGEVTTVVTWPTVMVTDNGPNRIDFAAGSHNSGSRFPIGTTQVIFFEADDARNVANCSFWITIEDEEAPEVVCPPDITSYVVIGVNDKLVSWAQPNATDNVGVEGTVTCDTASGTTFLLGMYVVECSAVDVYGNTGSCQFNVIVTEPVVQVAGSLTLEGTFTPSLMDPNSEDYMALEQKVVDSMDIVFSSSNESDSYGATTVVGFRQGSIIAELQVAFGRPVEQDDLPTFVSGSINKAVNDGAINNVDVVPDSAEFNDVVVSEPESNLKFNCDSRDSSNPSNAIVSIQFRNFGHQCIGVLITQQHVLTTVSCILTGANFDDILVGSRTLTGQEVTAERVDAKKIYKHPGYSALSGENDIAVMELQTPVSESIAQATCLEYHALGSLQLDDYQDCFIAGWGTLLGTIFTTLTTSTVSTLSNDAGSECDSYTYPLVMTKTKVCVSGPGGTYGMCTADTGSPLMCKNQDGGWAVIGLSNGLVLNGCEIGMYTHVSPHWQFISSVVDNSVITVPCDPIVASPCAASLPYLSTFVTTQSSYEATMQQFSSILSCHDYAELFFCSSFLQECSVSNGLVPCRGLCEEVTASCYEPYVALLGEGTWLHLCSDYPVAEHPDELLCPKGSDPTCGDTNLQVPIDEPLTLTSPNYPQNYPDVMDCTWFIEAPQDLNLVVKFKDLGIEECCDTMTIGSGSDSLDRTTIVKQFYGTVLASGYELIDGSKMWVRFQSDLSENLQGFHLEVYAVNAVSDFCKQPNAFQCSDNVHCVPSKWRCDNIDDCPGRDDENLCPNIERVVLSGLDSTTILSPGYPVGYLGNTDQIWVVSVEPQYQVHFMFMAFETEKDFDKVYIGQGDDPFASDSLFFEWSGLRIPPPIRSTGNALWIRFTADDFIFKDGFELTVTSVVASEPIQCLEDKHYDCGGSVCIPGGWQCDNVTDCIHGRDEYGCYGAVTCSPEEFRCGDGLCLSLQSVCNGRIECGDESDEIGCPSISTTQSSRPSMAPTQAPQPDCDSSPCYNGATCEPVADTFFCLCAPGYQGSYCDRETNECMPNPCKNRGECTDGLNSYSCQCQTGFTGDNCEIDIDECSPMPCQSGAVCIDGVNSYTCECPLGFQGDLCEIAPCDPIESAPCLDLLPYNTTVFPNTYALSQQDALDSLTSLASVLNCHPNAHLLHCSAFYPQCPWPDYGKSSTPCRSVCVEVSSACAEIYESTFNEPWPFDCDRYVAGEGTFCQQAEGDIFGSGLCGTQPEAAVNSRIVGGANASPGDWPWIGSLSSSYRDHKCGGTLINDRWVLTAAHCVGEFHYVSFGSTQLSKQSSNHKEHRLLKIVTHPMYDQTMFDEENDIAMVYLPERVNFTGFVLPSCLATIEEETLAYRECHAIGWGYAEEDGEVIDRLQEVLIPLISPDGCKAKLGSSVISDNMICAGHPQGGIDTCQGDSGGPLVCLGNDDVWHLVGVTSFGFGCGRPNSPGVYVRVSQYMDFIEQTIKETEESVETISLLLNVSQRITSPSYPNAYPSDSYKEWSITGPPGTQIILTILSHSTESFYDYINFGNGHDSADLGSLILTLDGNIAGQTLYSSASNEMWLYFVSDYSEEQAGFQYDLTAVNPGDFVTCDNGPQVIPSSWVCDQYSDCPSASDEQGCQ